MRDYEKLPLLTPREAYDRAREVGERPLFGSEYRVRNLDSWKAIETMMQEDDVDEAIIASFGLRRFAATLDAINMLRSRGWEISQEMVEIRIDGRLAESMAVKATYRGE